MVIQAQLLGIVDDRVRQRLFERQDFMLDEAISTCTAWEDLRAGQTAAETVIVHAVKSATRKYSTDSKSIVDLIVVCCHVMSMYELLSAHRGDSPRCGASKALGTSCGTSSNSM